MADHDISKALRSLRRQLGITQDALSKELHISRQLYAFYENGVRIPDAEMACELADFHHLTVNQLVHGQSSPEEAVLSSPSLTPASGEFFRIYLSLSSEDQHGYRTDHGGERPYGHHADPGRLMV